MHINDNQGDAEKPNNRISIEQAILDHDELPEPLRALMQHTRNALRIDVWESSERRYGREECLGTLIEEFIKFEGFNPLERYPKLRAKIAAYISEEGADPYAPQSSQTF